MLRNRKGMTLLEIMIVLVILGSLIGILAVQVQNRLKKARMNEARIAIGELGKALDMYFTDCGSYPPSDVGLEALVQAQGSCPNWGPDPYIKKVPKDPWNNPFRYENNGSSYTLMSMGADGKEGGTADSADVSSADL